MREDDLFPDISYPDPPARIRSAAAKIRSLRSQVGHDGLTPSATRTLVDELASALDEVARALGSRDS